MTAASNLVSVVAQSQVGEQVSSVNPLVSMLAFLLMLAILVVVHELGHFLTAVLMKIRVEEFGIGYPPRAVTLFERNGVKYTLNWLPLGGFVRFGGEDNTLYGTGSLAAARPWQKIPVMVAGPLMNLLLAMLVFAVIAGTVGIPHPTGTQLVGRVYPDTPAAAAGLQAGDEMVSLAGQPLLLTEQVSEVARQHAGAPIPLVVRRAGQELTLTITPGPWTGPDGERREAGIGISYGASHEIVVSTNPLQAVVDGSAYTFDLLGRMISGLARLPMAIGNLFQPATPSAETPIGPVGIARATGEVISSESGFLAFWNLTAVLSLNLFLLNLLPIPALDGSHIVFSLVEWVRGGKKVPPEQEALVHAIGFAALMGLMLLITVNDVIKAFQGAPVLGG